MADTIDVTNQGTEISSKGRKKSSGGKFDKKKKRLYLIRPFNNEKQW